MEVEQFERPMMAFPNQLLFQTSLALLLPRLPFLFELLQALWRSAAVRALLRSDPLVLTSRALDEDAFFFFTRPFCLFDSIEKNETLIRFSLKREKTRSILFSSLPPSCISAAR